MGERRSIKEPIPEIFNAAELLSHFADAHLAGRNNDADLYLREANSLKVWNWTNPHWDKVNLNPRHTHHLPGDTRKVHADQRDQLEKPTDAHWRQLIERDGYHCRYCGIPVIDDNVRKWLALKAKKGSAKGLRPYSAAVPWESNRNDAQHAALQCMWIQADHVIPHSHGGLTEMNNLVVSCALCNFGKWDWTLRQLGISDPRARAPLPFALRTPRGWDGLSRLVTAKALTYDHLQMA